MTTPFFKSLGGKLAVGTALIVLGLSLVIGGVAITSLRSLSRTADASVAAASADGLPADSVAPIMSLAEDISSTSSTLTLVAALAVLLGTIAAGLVAASLGRKTTDSIARLHQAVSHAAGVWPNLVEAHRNDSLERPELPLIATTPDEMGVLAGSFNDFQQTAASLAVQEPTIIEVEVEVATAANPAPFVNLGRRSQQLLRTQMSFIDALEKDETSPANLQRLFQIDHLATRLRRIAESIFVLADEESPRQLRRVVSMHQVVQAASSEIEHFNRVAISGVAAAAVQGQVATDIAHLLAELLENATVNTPGDAEAIVTGAATEFGYTVDITDQGSGMSAEQMAAANAQLAGHGAAAGAASSALGLDLVARLARRHGITVDLVPAQSGGVVARTHLPLNVLAELGELRAVPEPVASTPATAPTQPAVVDQAVNGEVSADQTSVAHESAPTAADLASDSPSADEHVDVDDDAPDADDRGVFGGLTDGERAAIEWASDMGAGVLPRLYDDDARASAAGDGAGLAPGLAPVAVAGELRAGPLDAAALAELLSENSDDS